MSSGSKARFPAEVDDLLRAAGWFPGRAVDTTPCSAAWAELGLTGGPTEFVREFDGLTVTHPPFVDVGEVRHFDHTGFGVVDAVAGLSPRMYREYSTLAGVDLYPVGEDRSHMTLMVGSGTLFAGVDNYLFAHPGGLDEAVARICAGARPGLVGEWSP
ncbi:SUKH-3 domain-containing protein [Actinokineospora sp. PR83]|uniref:SUKH-3 domain-containing protein n=1 Tax=Actinokineospora sp. PR83 TaxID=2884908 RepID=UPI0027DFD80F|nr:SUKH-3 domain-containing protein [Actinokineospora sp. PR83]MCG8915736.1 SUKH-3 domain-containing protein [Actinokineospora sp. PR83]